MRFSFHSNFKVEAFSSDIVTYYKVHVYGFLMNILNMYKYDCFLHYDSTGVSLSIVRTSSSGSAGSSSGAQLTKEKELERKENG